MSVKCNNKYLGQNTVCLKQQVYASQENLTSRSEQAPGSAFHPRDENNQIDCGFLGRFWCNKKFDSGR